MKSTLLEIMPELLELVISGLVTALLSGAGVYIEYFAVTTVQGGGDAMVGYWAIIPGLVCLGFAYSLAVDRVIPRVATLRASGDRA